MYDEKSLLVIAPKLLAQEIVSVFKAANTKVEVISYTEARGQGSDPLGVRAAIESQKEKPKAVVLVASKRRSPARLLPSPVINGVPVGIVFADQLGDLECWLHSLDKMRNDNRPTLWASLAMNKTFYLDWGQRFNQWMVEGMGLRNGYSALWMADAITKDEICHKLSQGPQLAIYAGHGRSRGWTGYRGLRWEHIEKVPYQMPCGTLISLACDTLKIQKGKPSFGLQWIRYGRACAYIGSVASVGIQANADFSSFLGEILKAGYCNTIGELLVEVDRKIEFESTPSDARKGFNTYRLLGNPLQALYGRL